MVLLEGDSILLGRRNGGPWSGRWCIPCGHVDWGEDIRDAARREMKEETGLIVEIGLVCAVHSNFHDRCESDRRGLVSRPRGRRRAGSRETTSTVGYFPLRTPPPLAFPTDATVIADLTKKVIKAAGSKGASRYSITWSARSSISGGIVRPSAFAVFRLMVR